MDPEQTEIFPRAFETTLAAKPSPICKTVSISFSVKTVKTGLTKPLARTMKKKCNIKDFTISTQVVATVKPASAVGDVAIFRTGKSRFKIISKVVDAKKGTITIKLTGTSMTPINKPAGDSWLVAKIGGQICKKVPVVVLQPYRLKRVSTKTTKVDGKNEDATNCSSPAWVGSVLPDGTVYLWTVYLVTQSIPVLDQFGNLLDKMYNGAPVFEFSTGDNKWHPINVTVNGGKYSDPVFHWIPRPGGQQFPKDSAQAKAWPTDPVQPSGTGVEVHNIRVMVAGVKLNTGVVKRNVVRQQLTATQANITINWK